ncbi:hypothetical protein B7P43_G06489 [Cryptotermes secundus]|uniref:Probable RNA polymerase II nuclear localization protein SLC7A6OS n=1 Tax=Cryptotermes secundus TaxID=105785 RepID=A0A2J7QF39_9NEOP|nr:probable RNA polymerase II nuclear localization protein SLC7A6OS [Cryptotermes secundus]PNF27194.1 hypothetical protein B7P43_G06489 [Cryptotermes secundus]
MAAVVRLKRRADEQPLEGLVLTCKKRKSEDDEIQITPVFKFAGTVKNREDVASHIGKILTQNRNKRGRRNKPDVTGKLRREMRHLAQENRLKVVNCFRALKDLDAFETEKETEVSNEDEIPFTVLDVVSGQESNPVSSQSQPELAPGGDNRPDAGYVYDLYYTSVAGSEGLVDLDNLSVHPLSQSYWEYQDPEDSSDMSPEEEDEDSNDENNWRNDYPDSDHSLSIDDMRMTMQMGDLNLSEGEELSSDDSDEDLIYGTSVDPQDVALYGEGYARYKARMKLEMFDEEESEDDVNDRECSSDEEEDDPARRFM